MTDNYYSRIFFNFQEITWDVVEAATNAATEVTAVVLVHHPHRDVADHHHPLHVVAVHHVHRRHSDVADTLDHRPKAADATKTDSGKISTNQDDNSYFDAIQF